MKLPRVLQDIRQKNNRFKLPDYAKYNILLFRFIFLVKAIESSQNVSYVWHVNNRIMKPFKDVVYEIAYGRVLTDCIDL